MIGTGGYRGAERRRWWSRVDRHLGFHGKVLILVGVCWAAIGYGIAAQVGTVTSSASGSTQLPHLLLPIPIRVLLWGVPGLVAVVCGATGIPRLQGIGFGCLLLPAGERLASFVVATAFDATGLRIGDFVGQNAWDGIFIWAPAVGMITLCSRVREQKVPLIHDRRRHGDGWAPEATP